MKESYKSTTRGAIYRKLRYRITAFCALVTGLVLLIAFAVAWQAARRQMSNADESLFLSQCQTVTAYVSSPYGVDTQTVLQFAGQNQLAVAVVDGGTLLTFVPDLQKETLTQLLASVQASAIGRGLYSSAAQSGNFMVVRRAKLAVLPARAGDVHYSVVQYTGYATCDSPFGRSLALTGRVCGRFYVGVGRTYPDVCHLGPFCCTPD